MCVWVTRAGRGQLPKSVRGGGEAARIQIDFSGAPLDLRAVRADRQRAIHQLDRLFEVAQPGDRLRRGGEVTAFARVEPFGLAVERERLVGLALLLAPPAGQEAGFGGGPGAGGGGAPTN